MSTANKLEDAIATAILGIDTLWGGDVMCPSGMGRFIADSWFSDRELPSAYTHPSAAKVRSTGGVSAKQVDKEGIEAYLTAIDVPGAIHEVRSGSQGEPAGRRAYLMGLCDCFGAMWDLALEILGKGPHVPYDRCVQAVIGAPPTPSNPAEKRERVSALLSQAGYGVDSSEKLLAAVDAWRGANPVPKADIPAQGAALIREYDALTTRNVLPYLPGELHAVPRSNVTFLPIENAWFSGSMNYLGRSRKSDGTPEYEATYEINAALEISLPEFHQLVSHEVVPGHVTTFAFLQNCFVRGVVGFEASVLTMNTRAAALCEGIANNAILMAHNVLDAAELPERNLELGVLLALLQDDAKNQASYLTWQEGQEQAAVAQRLREDFLVSLERADKLSGAWAGHPLLGRMYLPAYRAGTELVAELRRDHKPERLLPVLFGCEGLADVVTIRSMLDGTL